MPTISQAEINRLAYKQGVRPEDISSQLQSQGYTAPTTVNEAGITLPGVQQTPTPTQSPTTQVFDVGQQSTGVNTQGETTYNFNKPTIATTESPVIGTLPATTTTTNIDFSTLTPEQLKSQYMSIGTKLPGEVTDEDRRFTKYLQARMSLGETPDVIFGTKGTKSSGTTTYSSQLNHAPEQILDSTRNADGTWTVKYKDGSMQTINEEPSKTIFPEGTPEYYVQKQADESNKRLQVLEEQLNTEAERRKKETADLVKQYGQDIATQFQTQKADIEANGAKRMEVLNTGLSFSGFGRSTLALEKRDEIAKNIEATINQAKAKADLELMAYRMEREGADEVAIAGMRKNIADVQQKIDDANYKNQLAIIELNQQNATTGAEAMNNLLATISDSEQIVSNADLEKSQLLGYFVNKDGSIMLDSQKRPIQFEGTSSGLDPTQIQAYADAIKSGVMKSDELDKRVTPGQKADIMKLVGVRDGTYTPPVSVSEFIAKEEGFRDKAYWDVNGWAVGYGQHSINGKPVVEGQTITKQEADTDLANRVANARFNKLITVPLSESQKAALYSLEHNVGGGVWQFASIKPMIEAINKGDFNLAANILVQSGVGTRNAANKEVLRGLVARRQREADLLRQSISRGDNALKESYIARMKSGALTNSEYKDIQEIAQKEGWLNEYNEALKKGLETNLTPAQLKGWDVVSAKIEKDPEIQKINEIAGQASAIEGLLSSDITGTGFNDIALINAFQRIVDPGATVREGDVALLSSAVSFLQKMNPTTLLNQVTQGTKLTPKIRQQILDNTRAIFNARAKYGNDILNKKYSPLAQNYGLTLEQLGQGYTEIGTGNATGATGGGQVGGVVESDWWTVN